MTVEPKVLQPGWGRWPDCCEAAGVGKVKWGAVLGLAGPLFCGIVPAVGQVSSLEHRGQRCVGQ